MGQADELEQRLASHKGAASDPATHDVPPGFDDRLETLGASPAADAVRAERDRLARDAERLLKQLGSADNEVVQRGRRRQIRTIVNALRHLDRLAAHPERSESPDAGV